MKSPAEKLLARHPELVHSDAKKVLSHEQRKSEDWYINTIMIEDCDSPFRYKRKKKYKNLNGASVNLTYYPTSENVAGIDIDVMKVVRIRRA